VNRPSDRLLWLDCEFTGLNIEDDLVLEVGALVTTFQFNELATYQSFVHYPVSVVEPLLSRNPWWVERPEHQADILSGVRASKKDINLVANEIALFSGEWCGQPATLAGNSIYNDRKWIARDFPALENQLHYRMLDVTSLKIIAAGLLGVEYSKQERHRSMDDIRESVAELRFLLQKIGNAAIVSRLLE